MNWLEVSLTVNGELAESVADVFARFAPNGVMTEQGVKFLDEEDEGTATGPITVRAYLEVNEQLEDMRQKLEESLFYLGMITPVPTPSYKQIADQNWMEAWKLHYKPILIGQKLLILPAWLESPEPKRIAIKIDPGMAFGTGTHPTTQLCLELMEKHFDNRELGIGSRDSLDDSRISNPEYRVIDVGCGSGILSIAALKLGAKTVLGMDIDLSGNFQFKSAPLVVANILAPIIIRLFDAGLADLVEPNGEIILSGILAHQAENVIETAQAKGLKRSDQHQIGDWVALSLQKAE
jgi:ribosomal protein L11 methyltransferase